MKKIVLKLEVFDDKAKQKALKTVSTLQGIDSIAVDMNKRNMTVIGTVDPISVVSKLRKYWPNTDIIVVGPAKEPEKEKKEEPKKEEPKKEDQGEKKEGEKKEGGDAKKAEAEGEKKKVEGDKKKAEEEPKKEEPKKEGEEKKKEENKETKNNKEEEKEMIIRPIDHYMLERMKANYMGAYYNNHHMMHNNHHYYAQSIEENPNSCVIS